MNHPNPFVPQGSLLEQHKRRSRIKLAVFCTVAISVAGLTGMLIQGCKREQTDSDNQMTETNPPMIDTNPVPMIDTNPVAIASTNPTPVVPVNPVAPVTPVVPETPTTTEYVIVKGDTLGKIAKAHGVSLKALQEANPNVQPTRLKIGQKLEIPESSSGAGNAVTPTTSVDSTDNGMGGEIYSVKSGDTLTKIAKQHGTTVKAIESENNLSTTKIKVGQKLKIPAKPEAQPAPVTTQTAPMAPMPVGPGPSPSSSPTGQ